MTNQREAIAIAEISGNCLASTVGRRYLETHTSGRAMNLSKRPSVNEWNNPLRGGRMCQMMRQCRTIIFVLVLVGCAAIARADRVELNTGQSFTGDVVSSGEKDKVALVMNRNGMSVKMVWSKSEVREVVVTNASGIQALATRPPTTQELAQQKAEEDRKSRIQDEESRKEAAHGEAIKKEADERRRIDQKVRRFAEEQAAKGLERFQDRWVIASEAAYLRKADALVMAKAMTAPFEVFQALPDGGLCIVREGAHNGDIFKLVGLNRKTLADGDKYAGDLFWTGTFTYMTKQGTERTVNCYVTTREVAQTMVRESFGLFDKTQAEQAGADPAPRQTKEVASSSNPRTETRPAPKAFGSGFIVTKDGFVVTNNHVIAGADLVNVVIENSAYLARIVAKDPDNDIALLKIDGEFPAVVFASDRVASLGQTVFTVGFPLPELQGLSPKVTKGVISSLSGFKDDVRRYQVDASIQPGNWGDRSPMRMGTLSASSLPH